jgi:predicted DNA binding CopG/RHH family protein
MARNSFASSARAKSATLTPDSKLDLSDIPESTPAELRRARRVGRPATGNAKQLIAIRIAPKLLRQLRRMAAKQSKPYQTLIHELLEKSRPQSRLSLISSAYPSPSQPHLI